MENGRVLFGIYLIDHYCLGVKNYDWKADISLNSLEKRLPQLCGDPEPCSADFAHELIYGGLEYARRYGFEPHPDFKQACLILDPPEVHPPQHNIRFGKNGKPFFINGPYDNPQRVIATLMRTAGEGNFDYIIGFGETEDMDFR
jgi:hypothetical protein